MGRITPEQKALLNGFSYERLSIKEENKGLITQFSNSRGTSLMKYLQKEAWDDDRQGKVACYLIKDSDGDIAYFFSLKCGALFDTLAEAALKHELEEARSLSQFERKIQAKNLLRYLSQDIKMEQNEQVIRVLNTYPGIEVVQLYANESTQAKRKNLGLPHSIGAVLFLWHVAPLIFKIQYIAGCQYVFLFAADESDDGRLIEHYRSTLNFRQPTELSTSKPFYDMACPFMCQEMSALREYRALFFENFNPDKDDERI